METFSLNDLICDLRRKNLIYKEQMLSLKKEIEDKDKQIKENGIKSKILKNVAKFRPNWEANFRETIKLLEHVVDFCSEHEFFYKDQLKRERHSTSRILPQVQMLLRRLEASFECLKEVAAKTSESKILGNSSGGKCGLDLLSSAKQMKRVQTETELNISNEFKLNFEFIKEELLKKNYAFDVPTTSDDGSGLSKKVESKKSICTGDPKKVIYICSIEQQLSSEKKSYIVDKNRMQSVQNGFIMAEKQEQPEEARKKMLYNNIFVKEKERSFKTVESREMDQLEEGSPRTRQTTPAEFADSDPPNKRRHLAKSGNIFASDETLESGGRRMDREFIETVSKDSLREDLISHQKNSIKNYDTHKILENFSFNFNENKSFVKSSQTEKQNKENKRERDSPENLFQNDCESVKSGTSEENNLLGRFEPKLEFTRQSNEEQMGPVLSKSTNFEIESNYFNLRPVQRPAKTPKMAPKILFDRQFKQNKPQLLKNVSINQSSITSILTPKIKHRKSFFFEKENRNQKSFKFLRKNGGYSSNSQIAKSVNFGKKDSNRTGKGKSKARNFGKSKLAKKAKLGSISPNNFGLLDSKLGKKKTRSSKLFKMNMKSPTVFESKFRFTNLSNNLSKRTRFKTPKNAAKPKSEKVAKNRTKTFQKKYQNSLKTSLERVFRLKRKKSCNLQRKPYDSFVLHVNTKYSNKSLINKKDLVNLSFI